MALRLLLDERLWPHVARSLRQRGVSAIAVQDWHEGSYLAKSDQEVLQAAGAEGPTLMTCDVRSIPALLQHLAEAGLDHAGAIFISARAIGSSRIGALADALERFHGRFGQGDFRNRVLFLQR